MRLGRCGRASTGCCYASGSYAYYAGPSGEYAGRPIDPGHACVVDACCPIQAGVLSVPRSRSSGLLLSTVWKLVPDFLHVLGHIGSRYSPVLARFRCRRLREDSGVADDPDRPDITYEALSLSVFIGSSV